MLMRQTWPGCGGSVSVDAVSIPLTSSSGIASSAVHPLSWSSRLLSVPSTRTFATVFEFHENGFIFGSIVSSYLRRSGRYVSNRLPLGATCSSMYVRPLPSASIMISSASWVHSLSSRLSSFAQTSASSFSMPIVWLGGQSRDGVPLTS